MKKVFSILVVVSMLVMVMSPFSASGSTKTLSSKALKSKKMLVGYLIPDTQEPFLAWLSKSVKDKFAKDGVDVQIADAHGDATTQISQIENFTAMKANAIIIMAVDPTSCADTLKKAKAAGVKILTAGSDPGVYDAIMNTDQKADGELIAQMAANWIKTTYPKAAPKSVQVAIFESRSTPEENKRSDGMKQIEKLCSAAKVVKIVGGIKNRDTSMAAAENLFQSNPKVKVILAYNNAGALGASEVVTRPGSPVADLTKFGVFASDVSDESLQAIKDSKTNKSVFRGVVKFGSDDLPGDTYKLATKMITGKKFVKVNFDPLRAITVKNIAQFLKK